MRIQRKLIVVGSMIGIITVGISAIKPKPNPVVAGEYKNLKVLPPNISSKALTKIMVDGFEDELGVSCNFCHVENKETHQPDYASDEKPEKEIARNMMRMTIGINEKYFELSHPMIGDSLLAVTCGTCHHGQPQPEESSR